MSYRMLWTTHCYGLYTAIYLYLDLWAIECYGLLTAMVLWDIYCYPSLFRSMNYRVLWTTHCYDTMGYTLLSISIHLYSSLWVIISCYTMLWTLCTIEIYGQGGHFSWCSELSHVTIVRPIMGKLKFWTISGWCACCSANTSAMGRQCWKTGAWFWVQASVLEG